MALTRIGISSQSVDQQATERALAPAPSAVPDAQPIAAEQLSIHLPVGSLVKVRGRGHLSNATPFCVMEFVVRRIDQGKSLLLQPANVAALETTLRPVSGAVMMVQRGTEFEVQLWGQIRANPLDGVFLHLSLWHLYPL